MINQLPHRISGALGRLAPKNAFAHNTAVMVAGTVGGQLILISAAPLLTRLYSPADLGVLAVFTAILGILTVVGSLRYELAIPLPEKSEDAAHLVCISALAVLIITVFSAIIINYFGEMLTEVVGMPELQEYLWLIPLGVFFVTGYRIFSYWSLRQKAFGQISITRIYQSFTTVSIQILGYKLGLFGLLVGQVSGQTTGCFRLGTLTLRTGGFSKICWWKIKANALRYKKFPIYDTWYGLFFTTGQQLPPIILASLFGPSTAGLYMLSHRVLAAPMAVIGAATGKVFLSRAPEEKRKGNLKKIFIDIYSKLSAIAMPPAIILFLFAPQIFETIFGSDWSVAGEYASIMSIWLYMQFITSPLTSLFAVLELQKEGAIFQATSLVVRALGLGIGGYFGGPYAAIALFSIVSAMAYLLLLFGLANASNISVNEILKKTFSIIAKVIVCFIPLAISGLLEPGSFDMYWGFAISGACLSLWYWYLLKSAY